MFFAKKDKIIYIILTVLILIGISTGMNYQKNFDSKLIDSMKKTFEFGLFNFFGGDGFYQICFFMLLSFFKHFLVLSSGAISWITYPVMLLNLFGVGFKFGTVFYFLFSVLGLSGFVEIIIISVILIYIIFLFILYSKRLTDLRLKISLLKKIRYEDYRFLIISFFQGIFSMLVLFVLYVLLKNTSLKLYGLFKTFL